MCADRPKQYLPLCGRTVLEHALESLAGHARIAGVVVAIAPDDHTWPMLAPKFAGRVQAATGGAERCHSVLAGLAALAAADAADWVLVHDAARPCLRRSDVDRMLDQLDDSPWGGILAIPVRDTLKRCTADGAISATVDRAQLWYALTPQMFRLGVLRDALGRAIAANVLPTDEAQAIELAGGMPRVVEGRADNIKITRPEDLPLAELFIASQRRE